LLGCDIQKLEDEIFSTTVEEDDGEVSTNDTVVIKYVNRKYEKANMVRQNVQPNESLTKFQSSRHPCVIHIMPLMDHVDTTCNKICKTSFS